MACARGIPRAHRQGPGVRRQSWRTACPIPLEGDAGKLAQAPGYLLDNAVKFSHQGQVTLRVRAAGPLSGSMPLRIEVLDTGIGFVAPEEGRLYQRFHQLDGSMTRQYGGLGLAWRSAGSWSSCSAVVCSITRRRGTAVPSASNSNSLPVQRHDAVTGSRRVGGAPQRSPEQCTVLIVEDNPINQLVTRGMLLKLGYRVRTADNGAEALEMLRSEPIDAVLLDCQMPLMDGFATCRALRQLPGCADTPGAGHYRAQPQR